MSQFHKRGEQCSAINKVKVNICPKRKTNPRRESVTRVPKAFQSNVDMLVGDESRNSSTRINKKYKDHPSRRGHTSQMINRGGMSMSAEDVLLRKTRLDESKHNVNQRVCSLWKGKCKEL